MKKLIFILLMVIGFAAYGQYPDRIVTDPFYTPDCVKVNVLGVKATGNSFPESILTDTVQVEIIDMKANKVQLIAVPEYKSDTTYQTFQHPWLNQEVTRMYIRNWYEISVDLTGLELENGAYFIKINGCCRKLIIQ